MLLQKILDLPTPAQKEKEKNLTLEPTLNFSRRTPPARQPSSSAKKRRRPKLLTSKKKGRRSAPLSTTPAAARPAAVHQVAPATPPVFNCTSCKKPFSSEKRLQSHHQLFFGGSCATPAASSPVDPTRPFLCNACGYRLDTIVLFKIYFI